MSRLAVAVGTLALMCALFVWLALRVGATTPTAELAFVAVRDGAYDLRLLDGHRLSMVSLTRSGFPKEPPVWSPDGTRLAFNARGSSSGLYVIDADGRNLRQVADSIAGQRPSWSPDGKRLAFIGLRGGGFYVNVLDVDSGHGFTVTEQDGPVGMPTWSPDGTRLVFGISTGPFHGLYAIRVSGISPTFLTSDAARAPAWSPDGREIIYNSSGSRLVSVPGSCAMGETGCASLARNLIGASIFSGAASWSPDSRSLAWFEADGCPIPYGSVTVWSRETDQADRLFNCGIAMDMTYEGEAPSWSPDGRELAIAVLDRAFFNVYAVTVADGSVRRLTTLPNVDTAAAYPAWKP